MWPCMRQMKQALYNKKSAEPCISYRAKSNIKRYFIGNFKTEQSCQLKCN